jgi:hypothetical protein
MSKVKEAERPYVEARLYRCPRRSDCINPDFGQRESIALLLAEDDGEFDLHCALTAEAESSP